MKKYTLFFLLLLMCFLASAQQDTGKIKQDAQIILTARAQGTTFANTEYRATHVHDITNKNKLLYNVIDFEPSGYVILAADDNIHPLIAYSFDNDYPHEKEVHNFNAWMKNVEAQILNTRKAYIPADKKIRDAWNNIENPDYWKTSKLKSVSPLLHTEWNQGKYYNASCPEDPAGPDGHVFAGCVATALGQLMNYFRHPVQGNGYYSYTDPNYGFLEMDFSQQTYNWDAMGTSLNSYNPDIADLLYHIGISVDMQYGPDGSGMYNHKGAYTLRTYFGYDNETQYLFRDSLDENFDWPGMLIDHLDQNIPLYYGGWSDTVFQSGHAFIADGYQDSTYFHFNWGWGGAADGYFNLNSLTPSGYDFTHFHEAIANATPDITSSEACSGQKTITTKQGCLGDGSGPLYNYENDLECEWLIQPDDSVAKLNFELLSFKTQPGDELIIYDGPDDTFPVLETFSGDVNPQSFESTADNMLVRFITNSSGTDEGWLLSYDSEQPNYCDLVTTFTDSSRVISDGSNSYLYNQNTFCNWYIQPEGADSVCIQFLEFDVADGDYVKITDENENYIVANFTGTTIPEPFFVNSDNITLTFRSYNNRAQGWKLKYAMNTALSTENPTFSRATLYPNPASTYCWFSFYNQKDKVLNIRIHDTSGKLIYTDKSFINSGHNRIAIPVFNLQRGLYFISLTTDSKHDIRKLMIN
ncbi:MAG: C10 family peptidase [Bacteroidota bacterium]|nr:C10 family peptidase [Bacteroidota bacterium]